MHSKLEWQKFLTVLKLKLALRILNKGKGKGVAVKYINKFLQPEKISSNLSRIS
jgi:hypothetical protein